MNVRNLVPLVAGIGGLLLATAPLSASEGAAGGPFAGNVGNAVWTLVVFALVVFVLGKFAWGPILSGLTERENSRLRAVQKSSLIPWKPRRASIQVSRLPRLRRSFRLLCRTRRLGSGAAPRSTRSTGSSACAARPTPASAPTSRPSRPRCPRSSTAPC
jgi:hypothetical protein